MKYNKLILGVASAFALMTGACGENAWNDHLDGFEGNPSATDVKSVEYTLTASDYANVAGNNRNKLLAGSEDSKLLTSIGSNKCFPSVEAAHKYLPAFMDSTQFAYYTLSDGSAIDLTYDVETEASDELKGLRAANEYIVSDQDYISVWGSSTDYTAAFTPKHPASTSIPQILRREFPDAEAGEYVLVNYNTASVDPVFGGGGEEPGFALSNVISSLTKDATADINGVVTAVSTNGFILTDNSGSIFVYMGGSMDAAVYKVGTQVVCNAVISAYNTGLQVNGSTSTFNVKGEQSVTYPEPVVFNLDKLTAEAARTTDALAVYGSVSGKVKISNNNINIDLGSEDVYGGVYYAPDDIKAQLSEGEEVTVYGYFIAVAAKCYCNFVATKVVEGKANARRRLMRRVVQVPADNVNTAYYFNGSSWSVASRTVMLGAADYSSMGLNLGFISDPARYIPTFLRIKYPYAASGDSMYVIYRYGASADKSSNTVGQYVYNGAEWTLYDFKEPVTEHWTRVKGVWMYDPNVTVTLPSGKNQPLSTLWYQTCVDWVYENIDKPLGSTSITSGVGYVTKFGNNEFYSGTSAYQGNVDLRPSAARTQYPAGYEGMSEDEIVALMKKRFESEVMPACLSKIYPDVAPIEGIDAVIYTINFSVYDGSVKQHTIKYKVVGKGKFEFVECDW